MRSRKRKEQDHFDTLKSEPKESKFDFENSSFENLNFNANFGF